VWDILLPASGETAGNHQYSISLLSSRASCVCMCKDNCASSMQADSICWGHLSSCALDHFLQCHVGSTCNASWRKVSCLSPSSQNMRLCLFPIFTKCASLPVPIFTKYASLQGEVVPIRYHPFHGIYNVRMDEGCVLMASHCDMRLLQNHAEASSWAVGTGDIAHSQASKASQHSPNAQQQLREQTPAQQPGVCTSQQPAQQPGNHPVPMMGFEERAHLQQAAIGQDTHGAAKSAFVNGASPDLTALVNIARAMTQPAAAAAAATVPVGMMPDSVAQGTAARSAIVDNVVADEEEEQEEQKVVSPPQRRRTKQSVAQRMAPKRATPNVPASPVEPRSIRRKLSHAGHAEPAEPPKHIVAPGPVKLLPELPSDAAAVKAELPIRAVGTAGGSHNYVMQPAPRQQVNSWDHDSDDDLFVDLSGCNIVPTSGRKKQAADEPAATDSKQSAQTGGISIAGTDSAVASTPIVSARTGIVSSVMSPKLRSQSGKGRRASGKGRKPAQDEDDDVVLDLD